MVHSEGKEIMKSSVVCGILGKSLYLRAPISIPRKLVSLQSCVQGDGRGKSSGTYGCRGNGEMP